MHNKYTEMLAGKQRKAQDRLILLALPEHAILSRVTAIQYGHGGPTVYSFDGKPFLETYPPELETVREENAWVIKATQQYRIIKDTP